MSTLKTSGSATAKRVGMLGSAVGLVLATLSGAAAPAAAHPAAAAGNGPASSIGGIVPITAIPGSSEAVGIRVVGGAPGNFKGSAGLFRGHHWSKLKVNFGGRYGGITSAAAGSMKTVWVAGARQQPKSIQELPVIYRLKGHKLVAAKLPPMDDGATSVTSISASSPSNAWAVGDQLFLTNGDLSRVALYWNGKKWSPVDVSVPFTSVSTSSPSNAWAIAEGATYHWDGHTWTQLGTMPTGITANTIVTSAANRAYTVGPGGIARWTGKKWVASHKTNTRTTLRAITLHGKSGWAVGGKSTASGKARSVILHTSGGKWKPVKVSGKVSGFESVSTVNGKTAFASGMWLDSNRAGHTVVARVTAHKAKVIGSKF